MDWGKFEIEIERFPARSIEGKNIAAPAKDYLENVGLPSRCAPHLHFGSFSNVYLPLLSEWPWADDWRNSYQVAITICPNAYVVGSAQHDEPIVLLPDNTSVHIFTEAGEQLQRLNTSLENLASTVFAFAEMVECATIECSSSVSECRVPYSLAEIFINKFLALEPSLRESNSPWVLWTNERCKNA
ncbi:SUKH-4 family immunity protein [Undibacterium sp. Xuan67W]|uniref:SUKH-4 family immunity protein n=1 Tax=Undibacterium sp. Xuan67W TaxID=3413057 RepID=UPI003BF1539D